MDHPIAIVSDIHSNIEAMNVVLDDIAEQGIEDIVCLGDVIGYGADPSACLEIAMERFRFVIMGNHEEAVLDGAYGFNPHAKAAIDWTRSQLKPSLIGLARKRERWNFVKNLGTTVKEDNILYVHGSPLDHTMDYVLKTDCADFLGGVPPKITKIFEQIDWLCFIGHTHMPGIILETADFLEPAEIDYEFSVSDNAKLIVNIGSVGQPRDGDNRSCYVVFDGKTIKYRRLPYDWEKTAQKIRDESALDNKNADRLEEGR